MELEISEGYRPGAIGRIVELHGSYYSREWGFSSFFESRVASDLSEFINRYNDDTDRIWLVLREQRIEGSLVIDGSQGYEQTGAHLRWFIMSDQLRGCAMGKNLMTYAVNFCKEKKFHSIHLHTFAGLHAAKRLYEDFEFKLTHESLGKQWGTEVNEQIYRLNLTEPQP